MELPIDELIPAVGANLGELDLGEFSLLRLNDFS